MLKNYILISALLSATLLASDSNLNSDGSEYKAPRLAGDSLAIKKLDKIDNDTTASSIEEMFKKGTIKALIRYSGQHRDTSYYSTHSGNGTIPREQDVEQYSAIGGYLGYETASFYNISLGATFYTAHKLGNNPDSRIGLGGLDESDNQASSYSVLGEAYIKYKDEENDIRYGRREMPDYRFVSLSNIRFTPYTHEGATYENTMIKDTKVILGYITKQKNRNSDTFIGMARAARIKKGDISDGSDYDASNFNSNGDYSGDEKAMSMLGITYSKNNFNVEAWDYHVDDFVNTIYLYTDYTFDINKDLALTFAAQYANQQDVGDNIAGDVDTWFYGLKTQAAFKNGITVFAAYNEVSYNENSYDGGTIFVRWGTPQMFNSFQVQDSELAGTKSIGGGVQFELGKLGIVPNTVIRFRYADYNMPDSVGDVYAAQDRSEATFDLRYSFTKNDGFGIFTEMKGLSIQFRIAYDNYETGYDYAAHGVHADEVVDDFVDTRLYIDYMF
jgi:hypothetical protein